MCACKLAQFRQFRQLIFAKTNFSYQKEQNCLFFNLVWKLNKKQNVYSKTKKKWAKTTNTKTDLNQTIVDTLCGCAFVQNKNKSKVKFWLSHVEILGWIF